MSFPVTPYIDDCPDVGTCNQCLGKVCLSCGGDSSPVSCGDDVHCLACSGECSDCRDGAA